MGTNTLRVVALENGHALQFSVLGEAQPHKLLADNIEPVPQILLGFKLGERLPKLTTRVRVLSVRVTT